MVERRREALVGVVSNSEVFVLGEGNLGGMLTERTVKVFETISKMADPTKREALKQEISEMLKGVKQGKVYGSVEELLSDTSGDEEVKQAQFDFYDGIVMGTIFGSKDGAAGLMRKAIAKGDVPEIEDLLGNGVMKGAGGVMVEAVVRDGNLAEILEYGQISWNTQEGTRELYSDVKKAALEKRVNRDEAKGVLAYLTAVIEGRELAERKVEVVRLEEEKRVEEERHAALIKAAAGRSGSRSGTGSAGAGLAGGGKGPDSVQIGAMMQELDIPEIDNPLKFNDWIYKTIDTFGRNPLFFSGTGWQQIGPAMEGQITTIYDQKVAASQKAIDEAGERGLSADEMQREVAARMEEMKSAEKFRIEASNMIRALVSTRGTEAAIVHCDGSIKGYMDRLPPPGIMDEYQWHKDGKRLLMREGDSHVRQIRTWIVDLINRPDRVNDVVRHLKTEQDIDSWAEEMARSIRTKDLFPEVRDFAVMRAKARLAISAFIIEDYPAFAARENIRAKDLPKAIPLSEGGDPRDIPAVVAETPWLYGYDVENRVWRNVAYKERTLKTNTVKGIDYPVVGDVYSWSQQLGNNTCIQHPMVNIMRPVDIVRYKGDWKETILEPLEAAFQFLAVKKFFGGDDSNWMRLSEINPKELRRWDGMWTALLGGVNADTLDDFKDLLPGINEMCNMMTEVRVRTDVVGYVGGEIIYSKVLALMSKCKGSYWEGVLRSLALDRWSTPKELEMAMGAVSGSGMDNQFGAIKEAVSRMSLNLGTKHFNQAMAMLLTGTDDPERAESMLNLKISAMEIKAGMDFFSALVGEGSKKSSKSRSK